MATSESNKRYIAKYPERVKARWHKWYAVNKDKRNATRRAGLERTPRQPKTLSEKRQIAIDKSRLAKYGVSPELYKALHGHQHGLCAVCQKPEVAKSAFGPETRELCVDHNHTTQQVRALLCSKCNMAIGLIGEDILILRAMIQYLEIHSNVQ